MRGHVAIRQKSVFRLDQYLACRAHEDGAERMVAARVGASRHGEGAAQQSLVIERRHGRSAGRQAVPNFSTMAWKIRSGLNGIVQNRIPVASASALPSAA